MHEILFFFLISVKQNRKRGLSFLEKFDRKSSIARKVIEAIIGLL